VKFVFVFKCFKHSDTRIISKLIPQSLSKIALTDGFVLYMKLLTEVVKRVVNRVLSLQNKNRIDIISSE
jgi:hypothetical protein